MDEFLPVLRSPAFWILQFLALVLGVVGNAVWATLDRRYGLFTVRRRELSELEKAVWEQQVEALVSDPQKFDREAEHLRYAYTRSQLQILMAMSAILSFLSFFTIILVLLTTGWLPGILALLAMWGLILGYGLAAWRLIRNTFKYNRGYLRDRSAWTEASRRLSESWEDSQSGASPKTPL